MDYVFVINPVAGKGGMADDIARDIRDFFANREENVNIYEVMCLIGKKRGCIVSGGNIDDEKVSNIILDDFRTCKLGNITLEKVEK